MYALPAIYILTRNAAQFSLKQQLVDILFVYSEESVTLLAERIGSFR